ncbi:MAG TPA: ABC-F family ATP-binding cassette domain-containing protein [Anaerolineales bacterium]|nr:ABC-F family ATP-binding cassette domain-containing protein [Anaerolineales bacterium]
MLTAHHLHKTYGIQPILQDISFSINDDSRLGLIGPNGCGKTTLLRILAGLELPDSGIVEATRPGVRIGYLAQGMDFAPGQTLQSALGRAAVSPDELEAEIAGLASALSSSPDDPALQAKYDSALAQLASSPAPLSDILAPLGLGDLPPETPIAHLSGGQKTRLMLTRVLMGEPHLLLLDEPTNHLDIEMLEWLEDWLNSFDGAALIVSHDRAFLDNTVSRILDLNPETHTLRAYAGNYTDYLEQYLNERKKQQAAYSDQKMEIRRMQQDIVRTKEQSRHVEITTTSRQPGVRRIAKKVARKALAREKKLNRYLESEDRIERPKESWQIKLDFEAPAHQSQDALTTDQLSVGYSTDSPLLMDLNLHIRAGQRIALTGPNGAGKTTLIRTIAGKLEPLGGKLRLGASVKLGYMAQEQELLDPGASALQTVQSAAPFNETEARNFLHYFLFEGDDPLRPTRELSFGERARLQLGLLIAQGCTFLLLDEPINHLDIPSRARFEQALNNFKGTVLAVVHDRYFIERFASELWVAKSGRVQTM